MKTLALIPARSGSKGIPNKNTRDFCGKPLWQWAYEVGAKTCEMVVLSTDVYAPFANGTSTPFWIKRPTSLAQDDTPMLPVVQHALEKSRAEVVVLLQPTQPLRKAEHVHAALDLLERFGADSVVSVVEIPAHYSPDYALRVDDGQLESNQRQEHLEFRLDDMPTRRQDSRKAYSRDGTVYAIKRETVLAGSLYGKKCVPLVIPHSESCNLDTEEDWRRAEEMAR